MLLLFLLLVAGDPSDVAFVARDRFSRAVPDVRVCAVVEAGCTPLAIRRGSPPESGSWLTVPEGATLRVSAPGFTTVEVPFARRLELQLEAEGSIALTLVSPDEKRSLPAVVELRELRGDPSRTLLERELDLPLRPETVSLRLGAIPPGEYVVSWGGTGLAAGGKPAIVKPGSAVSLGTIPLETGVVVRGSVHDDVGAVAPGVVVSLSGPGLHQARSGRDGTFSIRGVPVGETISWVARGPGFATGRGILGGETSLEIVVDRAQVVIGTVVDPDGAPIKDASVWLTYRPPGGIRGSGKWETSSELGRFAATRDERDPVTLTVAAQGFRRVYRDLPERKSSDPLELDLGAVRLSRGRTLRGQVTLRSTGQPMEGVRITGSLSGPATNTSLSTMDSRDAMTDAQGEYELTGLADDAPLTVQAIKHGLAPQTLRVARDRERVDFALGVGGRVEGRVCGTAGELASSKIWYGGSSETNAEVEPTGRFVIENVPPGELRISRAWVLRDPLRPESRSESSGATETVVIVKEGETALARLACDGLPVSGTVLKDGRPLAGAVGTPALAAIRGTRQDDFRSDELGRFAVRVSAPGLYRFLFRDLPSGAQVRTTEESACQVPAGGTDACALIVH